MSESSNSARSRKAPDRPKKPYADFPLTPHPRGGWVKKIGGKLYYFGKWASVVNGKLTRIDGDGWREALALYQEQRDDLQAGRAPRVKGDGFTVAELCNRFLTAKLRKKDSGELGTRMFTDYKKVTDLIVAAFGANRLVDDLGPSDFEALRASMAKKWGPVRLGNGITRVKSVFKYGIDNGKITRVFTYGSEFKKPDKAVLRRHRAKSAPKMFTPEELRRAIEAAGVPLRAMILLGLNAGFGNHDCASLPLPALDLDGGWVNFPRPKTGISRRCPLWRETVAAIREAIAERPKPEDYPTCGLTFISSRGTAFVRDTAASHTDLISVQFGELLKKLGLHREGLNFYTLRHVFRTIADSARDPVAIDLIMGHTDPSMGAVYRERVEDSRLEAVVAVVRNWLFAAEGGAV